MRKLCVCVTFIQRGKTWASPRLTVKTLLVAFEELVCEEANWLFLSSSAMPG